LLLFHIFWLTGKASESTRKEEAPVIDQAVSSVVFLYLSVQYCKGYKHFTTNSHITAAQGSS
jgi:hypothetical protein